MNEAETRAELIDPWQMLLRHLAGWILLKTRLSITLRQAAGHVKVTLTLYPSPKGEGMRYSRGKPRGITCMW
ncbi:hypothetical protein KAR34_06510 [bacterium]|nr:hypothetical protein [bacterium]